MKSNIQFSGLLKAVGIRPFSIPIVNHHCFRFSKYIIQKYKNSSIFFLLTVITGFLWDDKSYSIAAMFGLRAGLPLIPLIAMSVLLKRANLSFVLEKLITRSHSSPFFTL